MQLLDVVALLVDIPQHHLKRGQVGTIVEAVAPDVYEVEFSDLDGQPYAMLAIPANHLTLLYHEPVPEL